MGGMAVGPSSSGSTHNPPYEQMLVRLGVGAGSMFHIGGEHRVSDMAPREGLASAHLMGVPLHGSPGAPPCSPLGQGSHRHQ
jgi:hypothetical protein